MALILCPECNREISDRAPNCPHCGCPIAAPNQAPAPDRSAEIQKYFDLVINGLRGQNSDQVEKYCQAILEIDPQNAKAWELEARGILFGSTLKENKIPQAISAAANAVLYTSESKEELAVSLYDSIAGHINGLLVIAYQMPLIYATPFVAQCMGYYELLLPGIPYLPIEKINYELWEFEKKERESKKSIMPKNRYFYASHMPGPAWHERFVAALRSKGVIQ